MSLETEDLNVDTVRDAKTCIALSKEIASAGKRNRFSYPFQDHEGTIRRYKGTIGAKWNHEEQKCLITFDYDDKTQFSASFSGENSLSYFARKTKGEFVWLNGEPKWFTEAYERREKMSQEEAAEGLMAFTDLVKTEHGDTRTKSTEGVRQKKTIDLIEKYGSTLKFIDEPPPFKSIREAIPESLTNHATPERTLPRGRKNTNPTRLGS